MEFTVIGSDQGLASSPTTVNTLLFETGSRYDIILDFKQVTPGNRVIMKNIGGDEPFGGDFGDDLGEDVFSDRKPIASWLLTLSFRWTDVPDVSPTGINFGPKCWNADPHTQR
ncbi:MAG: hypothetical protein H6633_24750 [Anaerolineales bacterium]|nr:hypothetical protein [Anaerolineales bacterium]